MGELQGIRDRKAGGGMLSVYAREDKGLEESSILSIFNSYYYFHFIDEENEAKREVK